MKYIPKVGEHLYTYRPDTGNYYIGIVKDPWTVLSVRGNECIVQEARCIFYGDRYYDTLADDIVEDPHGRIMKLRWNERKQRWQESPAGSYPKVAVFGEYAYYPYLD